MLILFHDCGEMGWKSTILSLVFLLSSLVYVSGSEGLYFLGDSTGRLVKIEDTKEIRETLDFLRNRQQKYQNQAFFVEYVFYRIHRKYLKKYTQYSSMTETLTQGKYDCVTGTALYAYLFKQLGFDITIKESTYHVYVTVSTDDGKVLIESTDPIEGAVLDPEMIRARELEYSRIDNGDDAETFKFREIANQPITQEELVGLLYFNQAVKVYNNQELCKAMVYVEEGLKYYPYERMHEMAGLVVKAMQGNKSIHPTIQKVYYQKYLEEKPSMASL